MSMKLFAGLATVVLAVAYAALELPFQYRKRQFWRAYEDFIQITDAYREWRKARPFLYAGQCSYSRSLILGVLIPTSACTCMASTSLTTPPLWKPCTKKWRRSLRPKILQAPLSRGLFFYPPFLYIVRNAFGAFFNLIIMNRDYPLEKLRNPIAKALPCNGACFVN